MKKCQLVILSTFLASSVWAQGSSDPELSPMPEIVNSSLTLNLQVNWNLAARGTEYRSMNEFASGQRNEPANPGGVAGPKAEKQQTIQGWIRAYGSSGYHDADGSFSEYDSAYRGAILGIDKNFGDLLIGLAGNLASTELDAQDFAADMDTYSGSLFSTYGKDALFIDAALTYGLIRADEQDAAGSTVGNFNADLYSLYLGTGYAFDLGERIALTPAASLLASYYDQDKYDRSGTSPGTVSAYDTSSYLASLGISLSTQHQIDWLKYGLAYIPEVRTHYIHEFNAESDTATFTATGSSASYPFRAREDHLFRVGFGIDLWSWKYEKSKLELDYDALLSDHYSEHIFSGKITYRF